MFKGLLIEKSEAGQSVAIVELDKTRLPEGDTVVRVDYSTLNYKDGLAITAKAPVVRQFPMVPGIDFAGTVETTTHSKLKPGDRVVLNGFGLGETRWGGLAQKARVPGEWLVKLDGLSSRDAMAIGTAGYTAMLCMMALEDQGVTPAQGEILVTGANGGVGSFAIGLLAAAGYTVVASTGRTEEEPHLRALGAADVIPRSTLSSPGKPLAKERWAGAIDTVGSHTLANVCASVRYGGVVAACGMAQGLDFPTSVAPFILRGVKLIGVDSVYAPMDRRLKAWSRLAASAPSLIGKIANEVPLDQVVPTANALMRGEIRGRVVVDVNVT